MGQENFKIKIGSQDVSIDFRDLYIIQKVGGHHSFELIIGSEERGSYFKGNLIEHSKKWIGESFEVEGLFKGIVTSVNLSRNLTGGSEFIINGQSPTVQLDAGVHARSFGEKNLKQIVDEVLKPFESKFDALTIDPGYTDKMKYCVQFRESHFSFLNRLASRYGEWFFYDGINLNFGKLTEGDPVRLNFERNLFNFELALKTVPVNFKLKGYDYKSHKFPETTASYQNPSSEYAQITFDKSKSLIYPETTEMPLHFSMSEKDLDQITSLRQNLSLNEMVFLTGTSPVSDLRLGSVIEVLDPRTGFEIGGADNYGKYVITSLTHQISGEGEAYVNHFEAIPQGMVLPPLATSPDPPLCELQEGDVMDNNDPKSLGRVRVQFMWQKSLEGDDSMTPWIRVASHSAGGEKGLYIIPEIGDRVLVAFEQNHPERPFVLTSMYHGEAKPEFSDPQNLKKALKTNGGNLILMNDESGKELMALSSPLDFTAAATGGDMTLSAKNKITITSESGDIIVTTPANISMDAEGNMTITIKGDLSVEATNISLKGTSSIKLEAPQIDIEAQAQLNAKGAQVSIEGQASTTVKGGAILNVESSGVTNVTGTMLKLN
ncbi:MAG: type VI secretion system tip protein VgrG [Saprospiraceae bacterium]|nr:type VI secretion system tip protein VgrG [Saprospiraceae bacterium]